MLFRLSHRGINTGDQILLEMHGSKKDGWLVKKFERFDW